MEVPAERRVAFINPFGTAAFDEIIRETLVPYASTGTVVDVIHLEGVPANIDYYYPKHLMELAIFEEVRRLEDAGYDAVVVGCCYDPGVRVARELVDIPVVGPLEAAMNHASYVGHRFTIITDHRKALPWLEDLVRLHGAGNCRGVRAIDWYVTDMIRDTASVANDAAAACLVALREDTSEVVILGCTIIGGCLEREIMTTGRHRELPILNPNLLALKAAESLADLHRMGKYQISRLGFYQRHEQHDPAEAAEVRRRWRLVDAGAEETEVPAAESAAAAPATDERSAVEAAAGDHNP
jgi:allantoin racemase